MLRSLLLAALLLPAQVAAQTETVDLATLARIRDEGMNRSQVMEHIIWMSDIYGPRLTGSTTMDQAAAWAMKQMRDWGLTGVAQERFAFGKGWELVRFSAHMIEPQVMPIIGMPKSWTRGTDGPVTADVVLAQISTESDLERFRGKLRGRIVLPQPERAVRMLDGRLVLRMTDAEIAEARALPQPRGGGAGPGAVTGAAPATGARSGGAGGAGATAAAPAPADPRVSAQRLQDFYRSEGVVAVLDRGSDSDMSAGGSDLSWQTQRVDGGTIFVGSGGTRDSTAGRNVPAITIAVEHYNRMVRILERNVPVRMELDVRTRFIDETEPRGFNIVAEIPGTDPRLRDEVVLIGAHFDSHHGATGATDNATGSAAMMEAMRIIRALGLQPRRTIRIALWGGEENGLLGSAAYARTHFADRATMALRPDHARLSAYYNIDNGTGRIRGIWMQQNEALRPIFEQWIAPLADLGVDILGPRSVSSTDHSSFDAIGLPAFQFVQERLEYNSRTHHSNMDFVDRVQADDMRQMATVVATFAWLTAQRDERLPRKPLPAGRDGN
jgi:carboxypeptidase Q